MQVQSINSCQYIYPKFNGIEKVVYQPRTGDSLVKEIKHKNTSYMFRPDVFACQKMYSYLSRVYEDVKKVNVYSYGCSLGYEGYSFILGMLSPKRLNPQKFFPVIAKDYDSEIIELAKKFKLPIDIFEQEHIDYIIKQNDMGEYFKELSKISPTESVFKVTKKLADKIRFSVADIRTDYPNIEPENSIIMANNFWPYMSAVDRENLAQNLANQLKKKSFIKIDDFDNTNYRLGNNPPTHDLLVNAGFKSTPIHNLFEKK